MTDYTLPRMMRDEDATLDALVPEKYREAAFEWKLGYVTRRSGTVRVAGAENAGNPVKGWTRFDWFRRAAYDSGWETAAAKERKEALARAQAAVGALTYGGKKRLLDWLLNLPELRYEVRKRRERTDAP
jgi:hypothetical protein